MALTRPLKDTKVVTFHIIIQDKKMIKQVLFGCLLLCFAYLVSAKQYDADNRNYWKLLEQYPKEVTRQTTLSICFPRSYIIYKLYFSSDAVMQEGFRVATGRLQVLGGNGLLFFVHPTCTLAGILVTSLQGRLLGYSGC